jgi:hypothetical protein
MARCDLGQKWRRLWSRPRRRDRLRGTVVVATGAGGEEAMRVYPKAVAITAGLLGTWVALLPLVA